MRAGLGEFKAGVVGARNDLQDVRCLMGTIIDELAPFRQGSDES
jgi:hypothetical protein